MRAIRSVIALSSAAALLAACSPSNESDSTASNTGSAENTAAATSAAAEAVDLNVFAASSTRVLEDDMNAAAGELDTPANLTFSFGGSSDLVSQLKEGAPADLLLTASKKTMDQAVENGSVENPQVLAENVMVMVVPKGNPAGIKSVEDIKDETVFALCDPQVPCGDVSSQIIEAKGLNVAPDTLESEVANVLGKVVSGEADAGWVYSTDAAAAGDDVEVIEIPGAEEFTNQILGAVVTNSENAEAAQGVLDMLANKFDATWEKFGFTPAD